MTVWEKATEGMDVRNWPHQFTKDGRDFQIGEDPATHDPIIAQPMICVHCHVKFVSGQTSRPPDPCPARTMQKEKKRLYS